MERFLAHRVVSTCVLSRERERHSHPLRYNDGVTNHVEQFVIAATLAAALAGTAQAQQTTTARDAGTRSHPERVADELDDSQQLLQADVSTPPTPRSARSPTCWSAGTERSRPYTFGRRILGMGEKDVAAVLGHPCHREDGKWYLHHECNERRAQGSPPATSTTRPRRLRCPRKVRLPPPGRGLLPADIVN